jgi:hypothetical protein
MASSERKSTLRFRLAWSAAVAVLLYVSGSSWWNLSGPPRGFGTSFVVSALVAVVWGIGWVWVLLQHRFFRATSAAFVAFQVVCQAVYVEGLFAESYYALSARTPGAFEPSKPLTGIDAAYFAISTATSIGIGDIHPTNGVARLLVSAQMIASLYLIIVAIATAVQRVLASKPASMTAQ